MTSFNFVLPSPEVLPDALRAAQRGPASCEGGHPPKHMSHTIQTSSKVWDHTQSQHSFCQSREKLVLGGTAPGASILANALPGPFETDVFVPRGGNRVNTGIEELIQKKMRKAAERREIIWNLFIRK